jgi:hypothetical protein
MEDPRSDHLAAIKRVLRYEVGAHEYVLHYTKHQDGAVSLVGYSDADMVGDIDTRKSTRGIVFFLGGNPITWQSSKQKIVVMSSYEVEYIPAVAACQAIWLTCLLADMTETDYCAPELWVDNKYHRTMQKPNLPRPKQTHRCSLPLHSRVSGRRKHHCRLHSGGEATG